MSKLTVLLMAGVACVAVFGDVPGSITTKSAETHKGNIRWSTRDKAYVVTKGNIELQVPEADVDVLDIDKPAAFDAAVDQVQKGQGAAAIPALQKIAKEYQHLQWDKVAGRYLAEAYIAAGKSEDALKMCERHGWGWALWNLDGTFGILDTPRTDCVFEDFNGHRLDRAALDLLMRYAG